MVNTHDCIFINLVIEYVTLNHFSDVVVALNKELFIGLSPTLYIVLMKAKHMNLNFLKTFLELLNRIRKISNNRLYNNGALIFLLVVIMYNVKLHHSISPC